MANRSIFSIFLVAIILSWLGPTKLTAEDFVIPIDSEDIYFWHILMAALEAAGGQHTLSRYKMAENIPQTRTVRAMLDDSSPYNVIFTGHNKERENALIQIDVPLTRGLFGYRVFVIHPQDAPMFNGINSLQGLATRITVGSGSSWPDTTILRKAGFTVSTSNTGTLWDMLARGRFTAFPRSVFEVTGELGARKNTAQDQPLMIEETVMLHYPFDVFFYVAPNDTTRAEIIKQGLDRIYANGTFMRIFNSNLEIKTAMDRASIQKRKIITLENPLNSERINSIPARFWHTFNQD